MSSSVETNGGDVEKGVGNPVVANDKTQEAAPVVADGGRKKKISFAKFINLRTCFDIVKLLLFLVALIALVVMAFQISRDQDAIQGLKHELDDVSHAKNGTAHERRAAGDISYMDGFSGMIEEKDTVDLIDRAVMVTGASSTVKSFVNATSTMDACDGETDAPETTLMPLVNVTSTSMNVTTTSPVTTTTVQAFLNTTVAGYTNTTSSTATVTFIASVDALSVSLTSLTVTSSTTQTTTLSSGTSTQTCGEWGDGAGPCDRPYGAPNTPPGSTPSTSPAMIMSMPSTLSVVSVMASQNSMPMSAAGFSVATSVDAISASTASVEYTTTTATTSSSSSSTVTVDPAIVCAPNATVYVTITASAVEDTPSMTGETANSSVPMTTTTTSTSLVTTLTETLPGTNGPDVVTETLTAGANTSTVAWVNGTSASASKPTLTLTPVTVTFTTAHAGNATYTGGGGAPTAGVSAIPLISGGEKAFGKPVGAHGSASGTGNGVYCVVMLVSLAALLI